LSCWSCSSCTVLWRMLHLPGMGHWAWSLLHEWGTIFTLAFRKSHFTLCFCLYRTWRTNLPKGACALVLTSVDHDRAPVVGVRVNVLLSRYLIEPCGPGKSKLTYMCRADLRYILILFVMKKIQIFLPDAKIGLREYITVSWWLLEEWCLYKATFMLAGRYISLS
jgi:hypothetical protein